MITGPAIVITTNKYTIQGTLTFDTGLPASGITTRLYSVVFGGNDASSRKRKAMHKGTILLLIPIP